MPRAWSPSGVRSGSSPGRASTRASVARLVALQALSAWIRSVPVVMSSCYAKSASLCPEWPVGDVPRDMPPEASWTAIRPPRTSTRGVGFLPAALLPGTPCTGGNFPLPICWVCTPESVYGIARQFLSDEDEEVRRSRTGVDPGAPRRRRTPGKPPANRPETTRKPRSNHRQNRGRTTGKTAVEPPENHRKTAGKPPENRRKTAGKPPENRRKTAGKPLENRWKTAGKPLENRWKTAGKPLENRWKTAGKPLENRWKTAGKPLENRWKTAGKPPGNRW